MSEAPHGLVVGNIVGRLGIPEHLHYTPIAPEVDVGHGGFHGGCNLCDCVKLASAGVVVDTGVGWGSDREPSMKGVV